jgi:hypothetical protein
MSFGKIGHDCDLIYLRHKNQVDVGYLKVCVLCICLILVNCSRAENESAPISGNRVGNVKVTYVSFPESGPALILEYETTIEPRNKQELRAEIDEIWPRLQTQLEANHLNSGAIRAMNVKRNGIFVKGEGYTFVFRKHADGNWRCVDDETSHP